MTHWIPLLALALVACGGQQDEKVRTVVPAAPHAEPAMHGSATFWNWFSDHAAELRETPDLHVAMERISAELEKAYPGLFVEIGEDGGRHAVRRCA